ncbi:hypothetical protein BOX30_11190 [Leptospirillum ferriphilum]|uniref:Uncharacterized protein n=1 Tax=Leptospirillum ferriphilum YSK TaxID=1441628 RepID=A0A059XY25_9BACT|nr:hypothetical protein Y981_07235 [Leptospirillum ferriphilum YSK]AKS23359.1 hypothetical protein ABH19_05775 [Leptospirillum sp. Group II 'CF-1']OOH76170.1 hypothetical protein BOX30_11190 [Leptospirillum ferriphilum]
MSPSRLFLPFDEEKTFQGKQTRCIPETCPRTRVSSFSSKLSCPFSVFQNPPRPFSILKRFWHTTCLNSPVKKR